MPLAPPVTMAVRPASLAMPLRLPSPAGEFLERRELLLDQVDRGRILELQRLFIEFLWGKGDDHFGPAEQNGIDGSQALPQVILRARAAEDSAGGRLQRDRLVFER